MRISVPSAEGYTSPDGLPYAIPAGNYQGMDRCMRRFCGCHGRAPQQRRRLSSYRSRLTARWKTVARLLHLLLPSVVAT